MNKIKKYRKEQGITLEKLSNITGLSVGYLSHLEIGTRDNPTMKTILKISTALNKPVHDIF